MEIVKLLRMNRRTFLGAAPVTIYATQGPASDPKNTQGASNGRFWVGLSLVAKIAWIGGFYDAAYAWKVDVMGSLQKAGKDPFAVDNHHDSAVFALPSSLSFGETSESLDRFYGEPTNRIIPIITALMWVDLKAKGISETALKDWESTTRASFATAPKQ